VIPGAGAGKVRMRTDGIVYTMIRDIPSARMENLANAFSDMAGVTVTNSCNEAKAQKSTSL